MPNAFAYLALFSWPIVAMILFRRLPVPAALAATIVGGYLFLPLQPTINFPVLPTIDRALVASLSAAVFAALAMTRNELPDRLAPVIGHPRPGILDGWAPKTRWGRIFLALILVGGFMTVFLNNTALVYETRTLPALKPYDAFSATLSAIVLLLPFFLGRKYLAHPQAHVVLLAVICVAGLLYSLPTLWEARMSPQLNKTFYGFFPDAWRQHLRGGGYRPLVFLTHGLQLGIFLCVAILAATAYSRVAEKKHKGLVLAAAGWLFLTLVVSKNMGALLIATALLPVVFVCGVRLQLLVATALALTVLTFPVLRGAGLLPSERIVAAAATIDAERASSLQFRLDNEEILLEKANDRPFFGWGGWGRARVFAEDGRDISTTDGLWIITLGEGGWTRYIGQFGLLTTSIVILAFRQRRYEVTLATSGLAVVLVANLVDLIPNTGLTPVTWLIAGALMGRIEVGATSPVETADAAPQAPDESSYRRSLRPGAAPVPSGRPARPRPGTPGRQPVYRRSLTTEEPRK